MVETLSLERRKRRESLAGLFRIDITDAFDMELVEDIQAAAPEVQILQINVVETINLDISPLTELKNLITLKLFEGSELESISLRGIEELDALVALEININPEMSIEEIDLTPLANHPELRVVTIACLTRNLKGLEVLRTIPNLESMGFYSLDMSELDLSDLSGCQNLESMYFGELGQENPIKPFSLKLPRKVPLKIVEVSDFFSEDMEFQVDFEFLRDIESMDSLSLRNCNLTSFDFTRLSSLKRIGRIDLSENRITHLDITPILDIATFTENALGEPTFIIDSDVIIQIEKKRQDDIPTILSKKDKIVEEHKGSYAIDYEFGHQWLRKILDTHSVEWI
ncbi:hypothetical protein EU527_09965 [Candidatus Thorarchaeota archaeon]|nr:MAG: hypothetical protein EU527_09965 [Candidatus Thorarchaeota archaeon]